jgi:hypothetical protein
MVAGIGCYLAAAGVDVVHEAEKASLVLSSDQKHLVKGCFEVDRMMSTLEDALDQALADGYDGLWAIGDMSWEFGPQKDFQGFWSMNGASRSFSANILFSAASVSIMRTHCPAKCCGKVCSRTHRLHKRNTVAD